MSANVRRQLEVLPEYLANHLEISIIALGAGVLVSLPLAVLLARRRELRYPVLAVAGIVQTVPSLALLALMVPLLDSTGGLGLGLPAFGFWPAVLALSLYSILPMLRNAVTGLTGVDADMTEAARAVGMTPRQVLLRVELPLAAPVLIAGLRTATVWVVGIATLATPVGQTCLGNYIFTGLQTQNWIMVLFGVAGAAALALVLDLLIGGLQHSAEERRRGLALASGGALLLVVAGGLVAPALVERLAGPRASVPPAGGASGSVSGGASGSVSGGAATGGALGATADGGGTGAAAVADPAERAAVGTVRIGAKSFTEQYVLASLVEQVLQDAGYDTDRADSLGSTVIFDALCRGDVDVYVDYTGTIWANHMRREGTAPAWQVLAEVEGWLAREHGVRSLGALGFENAYALAMRRDRAEALGVESIADLRAHAGALTIGADYEFFERPEWRQVRAAYGLAFGGRVNYESTLMYEAVSRGEVDVISAFSSDGRIAEQDLLLLADERDALPPYDAVLLLSPRVADVRGITAALAPLVGAMDLRLMQRTNLSVDRGGGAKLTVQGAAARLRAQVDEAARPRGD